MKKKISYQIQEQDAGKTAAQFLRDQGYSCHLIKELRTGPSKLLADGQPVFTIFLLQPGQTLTVVLEETSSSPTILPVQMPLSILYEDEDIFVINKPANMPVHPSQGHFDHTLANAAAWHYRQKGEDFVYRAVHRLDRDTTGALLLARHKLSACLLSAQMAKGEIHREYRALVCGHTREKGTISAPIGRTKDSTIKRQIDYQAGEPACTHYQLISYNEKTDLSYLSLRLETGRTHQIRVHMASVGHPLPGDFLYHPDYSLIDRQPLHSYCIQFLHPLTGNPMELFAPLPEDMARLICDPTPI